MKFEDIESTWALQQPATPTPADLEALRGRLVTKLRQRRRLLAFGIATTVLGLLAMQAVFIANLTSVRGSPPWTFALHLLLNQGVNLAMLCELVRAFGRHRRLANGRAESVRAVLELSLRNVADQIWDFHFGRWVVAALVGTALFSAYLNQPVSRVGWAPFAGRAAAIVTVFSAIALMAWHHYRHRLQPERDHLQATLAELGEGK
jgi:hypothetical protein